MTEQPMTTTRLTPEQQAAILDWPEKAKALISRGGLHSILVK